MRHITAIAIKLVGIFVLTLIVLTPLARVPFGSVLIIAIVNTAFLYAVGDMVVLPTLGNWGATLGDGGIAFLVTWLAPLYTALPSIPVGAAFGVALLVGIFEFYFHRYLKYSVFAV
jgi:hypothetical protein